MTKDVEVLKILGKNIRRLRKAQGLTQVDIEVRTGIASTNISLIERGFTDLQATKLIKIATALGVQLGSLYFIKDESN